MSRIHGINTVTDGLMACWDVGNRGCYPGSGTTLANLVGKGRRVGDNLIVNGSPTFTSTFPSYFTFSIGQTTQYLIDNPFTMPPDDVTFEMWVRFLRTDKDQSLMSYAVSGDDNNGLIFLYNGILRYYGPNHGLRTTGWTPTIGVWHQVVRRRTKSTGLEKLYVDGEEEYSNIWRAGNGFSDGGAMVFGQEQDSVGGGFQSSQCFGGDFALLRVYNRALTQDELIQNYNAVKVRFGR